MILVDYGNCVKELSDRQVYYLERHEGHRLNREELREKTREWAESSNFGLILPSAESPDELSRI